jgi:hypothetical protein
MNSKHMFLNDTEYKLLAVGAYSFAAFSIATIVQILSAGPIGPAMEQQLAKVAITTMPMLAAGLALDFYCVGKPKQSWLAPLLCLIIGALIGVSSTALGAVLGIYSPQVAVYMNYGSWAGIITLVFSAMVSGIAKQKTIKIDDNVS